MFAIRCERVYAWCMFTDLAGHRISDDAAAANAVGSAGDDVHRSGGVDTAHDADGDPVGVE